MERTRINLGTFGLSTPDGAPLYLMYSDARDPRKFNTSDSRGSAEVGSLYLTLDPDDGRHLCYFAEVKMPGLANPRQRLEGKVTRWHDGMIRSYLQFGWDVRETSKAATKLADKVHAAVMQEVPRELFEPCSRADVAEAILGSVTHRVSMAIDSWDLRDYFENGGDFDEGLNTLTEVIRSSMTDAYNRPRR